MAENTQYLGDGLYAELNNGHVCLYAFNGLERTNEVFMDSVTLTIFLDVFLPSIGVKTDAS